MSTINESPVHQAIKALETAMRASSTHHHRLAQQAYHERPAPPVGQPVSADADRRAGGAA